MGSIRISLMRDYLTAYEYSAMLGACHQQQNPYAKMGTRSSSVRAATSAHVNALLRGTTQNEINSILSVTKPAAERTSREASQTQTEIGYAKGGTLSLTSAPAKFVASKPSRRNSEAIALKAMSARRLEANASSVFPNGQSATTMNIVKRLTLHRSAATTSVAQRAPKNSAPITFVAGAKKILNATASSASFIFTVAAPGLRAMAGRIPSKSGMLSWLSMAAVAWRAAGAMLSSLRTTRFPSSLAARMMPTIFNLFAGHVTPARALV